MKVQIANIKLVDGIMISLQHYPLTSSEYKIYSFIHWLYRRWRWGTYNKEDTSLRLVSKYNIQLVDLVTTNYPALIEVVKQSPLDDEADKLIGKLQTSSRFYCREQAEIFASTKNENALRTIASNVIEPSELGQTLTPYQRDLCMEIVRNILD